MVRAFAPIDSTGGSGQTGASSTSCWCCSAFDFAICAASSACSIRSGRPGRLRPIGLRLDCGGRPPTAECGQGGPRDRSDRRPRFPERRAAAQRRVFHSKVDTIRPTYGFEDVSLAPGTDTIEPADVDLAQTFCGIDLAIPILASAMDAVVDASFAGALGTARRARGPQPRGRPDPLRRSGCGHLERIAIGRRRRGSGAARRGLPGSRSARS